MAEQVLTAEQTADIQRVDQVAASHREGYDLAVRRLGELANAIDDADGATYAYKLRQAAGLLQAMYP